MRNVRSTCESIAQHTSPSSSRAPGDADEYRPSPWFCPSCRPTGSNPFHPSRGPLAAILPLFLRRLQCPIPVGLNLLLMPPGEHVLRRDVTDSAVKPMWL
jgi:hypothetical protein